MSTKILMIGWEFPPKNSGGLGVACKGIVEHLVDSGSIVTLVLPKVMSPSETCPSKFYTEKGNSYDVIFVSSRITPYATCELDKYGGNIVDDVYEYAEKISNCVTNVDFDIIHIHDWLTVPAGLAVKERTGKPLVMHVHSTEFDRTAGGSPYEEVSKIETKGFAEANLLISVSSYTRDLLTSVYGVDSEKVRVVHNGIDKLLDKKYPKDFLADAPVVIFVGRLTIQKGPEYFIQIAKQVTKVFPDTVFVFAGDGDMYKQLVESSAMNEMTGSVLFAGFLQAGPKTALYHRADVFVMPSVSEPFGLVALEAAQMAKPVIVSKTSGVAEALPSAIKVDYWDTDLMAKYVIELISDKERSNFIGQNLKKESEEVSWDKSVNLLKEIYQELKQKYG